MTEEELKAEIKKLEAEIARLHQLLGAISFGEEAAEIISRLRPSLDKEVQTR